MLLRFSLDRDFWAMGEQSIGAYPVVSGLCFCFKVCDAQNNQELSVNLLDIFGPQRKLRYVKALTIYFWATEEVALCESTYNLLYFSLYWLLEGSFYLLGNSNFRHKKIDCHKLPASLGNEHVGCSIEY
ncbi:hypothetical protein NMG60_11016006 [Bertholletia excelsa]